MSSRQPFLKKGDKAIIVTPSGNVDSAHIDGARTVLEDWGLEVEVAAHARNKDGRFCGSLEQRISDFQMAMDDSDNRLIFCSRGGYGAVHLLESLDFTQICLKPKLLLGYSDITALHQLFMKNGLQSVHAPMARHLSENPKNISSLYLKELLFGEIPSYRINGHALDISGDCTGVLFGGNLAVLCSLLATDYVSIPDKGILFIEDIGEKPYQIDRMIWTLKLSGVFEKIGGLVVGSFTDAEEDPLMYQPIYESVRSLVEGYNIPVSFNFPVGHTDENYPLLHGAKMNLIVRDGKVELKSYN